MPKYEKWEPRPKPIEHRVHFSHAEVIEALRDMAARNGIQIPNGKTRLLGLEHPRIGRDSERTEALTLVIDEAATEAAP